MAPLLNQALLWPADPNICGQQPSSSGNISGCVSRSIRTTATWPSLQMTWTSPKLWHAIANADCVNITRQKTLARICIARFSARKISGGLDIKIGIWKRKLSIEIVKYHWFCLKRNVTALWRLERVYLIAEAETSARRAPIYASDLRWAFHKYPEQYENLILLFCKNGPYCKLGMKKYQSQSPTSSYA